MSLTTASKLTEVPATPEFLLSNLALVAQDTEPCCEFVINPVTLRPTSSEWVTG